MTEEKPPEKPFHQGTANLIPPVHGEIRNPKGKPKGTLNRKTIFRRLLEQAALEHYKKSQGEIFGAAPEQPQTVADQIAAQVIIKAMGGDMSAIQMVMDSAYDKLVDKLDVKSTTVGSVLGDLQQRGPAPLPKAPKKADECQTITNPDQTTK